MTTIAYRDGVMAADSMNTGGNIRLKAAKLYWVENSLIGVCGVTIDYLVFLEWMRDGSKRDEPPKFLKVRERDEPNFEALVLNGAGLTRWSEYLIPIPVMDEFFALGTGATAALGAMHMGASAERAVEVAKLVDVYTGGEVQVEKLCSCPLPYAGMKPEEHHESCAVAKHYMGWK